MTQASCKGERFGHNFIVVGGDCTECGVNQAELSGRRMRMADKIQTTSVAQRILDRKPMRGMHSELHLLIDELRAAFGETAKKGSGSFSFYLGHLQRIGFENSLRIWSEVKQSNARDQGRLFWWKYKNLVTEMKERKGLST